MSSLYGFDDTSSSTNVSNDATTWKFYRKSNLSVKNNPLCGITLVGWLSLLWHRGKNVEWLRYWPRLLLITILACLNSILGIVETFIFEKEIQSTELNESPVFILGHPRTGTTLLHGLLALDQNFATCSTFCSGFPSAFLWFEGIGKILFSRVIDETRPMDNVRLSFDLPQEDELATNLLILGQGDNGGCSPYMPLFFMKQEPDFRPYYSFSGASESPEVALALQKWKKAFLYLLKKLTLRALRQRQLRWSKSDGQVKQDRRGSDLDQTSPRLLLKSPVHTSRVSLLLQLFPKAQFVYIHRHPYEVFASAAHMADTTYWFTYLNTPSDAQITEFILKQYEILWSDYERCRVLVPENQLVEVSFQDLCDDPKGVVGSIYSHFGWPGWSSQGGRSADAASSSPEPLESVVERMVHHGIGSAAVPKSNNLKGKATKSQHDKYARNVHRPLPSGLREIVDSRWGDSFLRLGYSKQQSTSLGSSQDGDGVEGLDERKRK